MRRTAAFLLFAITAAVGCQRQAEPAAVAVGAAAQAPLFEVDPLWPKPLPNGWVLGSTIGVSVGADDHVWIIHRPESVEDNFKAATFTPPIGTCCTPAPPVLEFD